MKLRVLVPHNKKYSCIIALVVAALAIYIPKTDARACCHKRPSSTRACCHKRPSSGLSLYDKQGNVDWINSIWDFLPPGGNMMDSIMNEIFRAPQRLDPLIELSQRHLVDTMPHYSPSYEITDSDKRMELALDLPGVHPDDVSIALRDGGRSIGISGLRKYKRRGEIVTSKFEQMFTIDDAVIDVETIEANLSEGVLVLSALKKAENKLSTERTIPILQTEAQGNTSGINNTEKVETNVEDKTRKNPDDEKVDTDDDIKISLEEDIIDTDDDIEISQEEDII